MQIHPRHPISATIRATAVATQQAQMKAPARLHPISRNRNREPAQTHLPDRETRRHLRRPVHRAVRTKPAHQARSPMIRQALRIGMGQTAAVLQFSLQFPVTSRARHRHDRNLPVGKPSTANVLTGRCPPCRHIGYHFLLTAPCQQARDFPATAPFRIRRRRPYWHHGKISREEDRPRGSG